MSFMVLIPGKPIPIQYVAGEEDASEPCLSAAAIPPGARPVDEKVVGIPLTNGKNEGYVWMSIKDAEDFIRRFSMAIRVAKGDVETGAIEEPNPGSGKTGPNT